MQTPKRICKDNELNIKRSKTKVKIVNRNEKCGFLKQPMIVLFMSGQ